MRDADYAIAAVMVGTVLITWTLGRIFESLRVTLAVVQMTVIRVCVGLIFAIITAQAVRAGGLWLLLTPVFGLLALFSLGLAAGFVWAWARGELTNDT